MKFPWRIARAALVEELAAPYSQQSQSRPQTIPSFCSPSNKGSYNELPVLLAGQGIATTLPDIGRE